jgi:hypothetical protein
VKALVERYVRSLKERDEHPERENDLGTLVCWILDQYGYRIIERAFKHALTERRVSKGRAQFGIDILAVKDDPSGNVASFRFVLKRGDVRAWAPGEKGELAYDLCLAATVKGHESRYGISPHEVTIIAVHNGDRDSEALGPAIEGTLDDLRRRHGCRTDWWDAARLAELIVGAGAGMSRHADTSIFPPDVQPFMRMALDSLLPEKGMGGGGFDLAVVDVILDRRLSGMSTATRPGTLHRILTELALFAWMVRVECDRVAEGSMLPVLDTLEHVMCAATAAIAAAYPAKVPRPLRNDIHVLQTAYIEAAIVLRTRLAPVASIPLGLALPLPAERIDYPIRVLRLCGYLAAAGIASLSTSGTPARAIELAQTIEALWASNEGAATSPVTDDQLIELVLIFELWASCGMGVSIHNAAISIINRHAKRSAYGLPLPSSSHRARVPMRPGAVAALVAAHLGGEDEDASFTDRGTTLLPALFYAAHRLGASPSNEVVAPFLNSDKRMDLQVWQPPTDAGQRWYREELDDGNTVTLTHLGADASAIIAEFERVARFRIDESQAERIGFPAVDRIAWKVTRTPPPMSTLAELLDKVGPLRQVGRRMKKRAVP